MTPPDFNSRRLINSAREDRRHEENPIRIGSIANGTKGLLGFLVSLVKRILSLGLWKIGALGALGVFFYLLFLFLTLPDISDPRSLIASQSTVIQDRNGIELYRLFNEEDRTFVDKELLPLHLKQAMIAIEDERFYEHGCVDMRAIFRAAFANVFSFKSQGGSTITQQLARNALLTREKRISRKIKEIMLACQLEGRLSKDELLELYMNWIPFGENAYGIGQASKRYFNTDAETLTLAQSVVLAALPQRPSYFSPYGYHVRTEVSEEVDSLIAEGEITNVSEIKDADVVIGLLAGLIGTGSHTRSIGGRTDQVLRNMQDQGFIQEADRLQALEELETIVFEPSRESIRAPHFVLWVRAQVEEMFAGTSEEGLLEAGGLTVETTLDWGMQQRAEDRIAFHRDDVFDRFGASSIALIAVDNKTREILAYVGNTDYNDEKHGGKIDMVHAPRQPGSSFKPFVYAAAFGQGYGPATPIYDVPTKIGDDEPQNFDGKFLGLLTMRTAIAASRNIPAAKTFFLAGGEEPILGLASAMGARTPFIRREELKLKRPDGFDYGWPLALGSAETPLFEMVQAYSTFAAGGKYMPLQSIRRIIDKQGNILFKSEQEDPEEVLDERIAYQITSVLSDVSARPEEYWRTQLTIPGFQTAGKTGTSNKCLEWKEYKEKDEETGRLTDKRYCKLRKPNNAWLIGYTPMLTAGVWVGNADGSSLYDKAGGLNTASPIWQDFMASVHRMFSNPKTQFDVPEGIVQPQISTLSGQLPTPCTPLGSRKADVFLIENAPRERDPACKELVVDKLTYTLASDACPKSAQESGSFLVVSSLLPERFPEWREGIDEWTAQQMERWNASPDHSGSLLPLAVAPTEICDPSTTPGRLDEPTVTIVQPARNGIASYPSFRPKIEYEVGSRVREVTYKIDGKKVRTVTNAPFNQTLRVPRSVSKTGMHNLEVILVDQYFNSATARTSFRFEVDVSGPQVLLILPKEGAVVPQGSTLAIRADASDSQGGIKYVQFYLDDLLLSTKPNAPYEMEYTIEAEPGTYRVRVEAKDLAGNDTSDEVMITVE